MCVVIHVHVHVNVYTRAFFNQKQTSSDLPPMQQSENHHAPLCEKEKKHAANNASLVVVLSQSNTFLTFQLNGSLMYNIVSLHSSNMYHTHTLQLHTDHLVTRTPHDVFHSVYNSVSTNASRWLKNSLDQYTCTDLADLTNQNLKL